MGMVTLGKDARAARIVHDIYRHTMRIIAGAEAAGGYETLSDHDAFHALEHAGCREHYFLGAAWVGAMLVTGCAYREAQCECVFALGRREIGVARAHREAVFFSNDRHGQNFDVEV